MAEQADSRQHEVDRRNLIKTWGWVPRQLERVWPSQRWPNQRPWWVQRCGGSGSRLG